MPTGTSAAKDDALSRIPRFNHEVTKPRAERWQMFVKSPFRFSKSCIRSNIIFMNSAFIGEQTPLNSAVDAGGINIELPIFCAESILRSSRAQTTFTAPLGQAHVEPEMGRRCECSALLVAPLVL